MMLWIHATARQTATEEMIGEKRHSWVTEEREAELMKRCKTAVRYNVEGVSPRQVFWIIETEDSVVSDILRDHFGDLWDLDVRVVKQQSIADTVN